MYAGRIGANPRETGQWLGAEKPLDPLPLQSASPDSPGIGMNELPPQNPIETLLQSAMEGTLPIRAFMQAFVAADVVLLTGSLVTADGSGFDPLLFDKQGVLHVAVFTDMARVGFHNQQAPHTLRMRLFDVLHRVPAGYGLVVNPGTSLGLEIAPAGIGEILKDFS